MEPKSQNKVVEQTFFDSSLRIQVNPDSSVMLVEVIPDFSFNFIAFIGLTLFSLFLFFTEDALVFFVLLFWGMLAYSIFTKRKIRCSINKITDGVHYFRSGILNTKFDESESNFAISEVTHVEMLRHIRRYGDTFQILLTVKRWEKVEMTGKNLSFSDCQSYAEKIRDFIDPSLLIKAVG